MAALLATKGQRSGRLKGGGKRGHSVFPFWRPVRYRRAYAKNRPGLAGRLLLSRDQSGKRPGQRFSQGRGLPGVCPSLRRSLPAAPTARPGPARRRLAGARRAPSERSGVAVDPRQREPGQPARQRPLAESHRSAAQPGIDTPSARPATIHGEEVESPLFLVFLLHYVTTRGHSA